MRVASQLTFCSPQQVLRRAVVEQDELKIIKAIFSLDESSVESSHTLFYDGIISAEIISAKSHATKCEFDKLIIDYQFIDLTENIPKTKFNRTERPLILDFGTNEIDAINLKMAILAPLLKTFSALEIIAACTYYPAILCGINPALAENRKTDLLLWENLDLVNRQIALETKIRIIG
jgi:hypothetical protein